MQEATPDLNARNRTGAQFAELTNFADLSTRSRIDDAPQEDDGAGLFVAD